MNIVRNFQILIVLAVEICKQCLRTASGSGELRPYWDFAPRPYWTQVLLGDLRLPGPLSYSFPNDNSWHCYS